MNGLYRPGSSPVHRARPWVKLLVLATFTTLVMILASPTTVGVGALAVVCTHAAAGFGPRVVMDAVWPLRWFVLAIAVFQLIIADWRAALTLTGSLAVCVTAANLVTLTTRVLDLLDSLTAALRPVRRVVDPERVALLLALTMRSIPVMSQMITEARQARAARGQEHEWRTLLTAVVIRSLHRADHLAEALAARGMDD